MVMIEVDEVLEILIIQNRGCNLPLDRVVVENNFRSEYSSFRIRCVWNKWSS